LREGDGFWFGKQTIDTQLFPFVREGRELLPSPNPSLLREGDSFRFWKINYRYTSPSLWKGRLGRVKYIFSIT